MYFCTMVKKKSSTNWTHVYFGKINTIYYEPNVQCVGLWVFGFKINYWLMYNWSQSLLGIMSWHSFCDIKADVKWYVNYYACNVY
jgi:hypothetical protein